MNTEQDKASAIKRIKQLSLASWVGLAAIIGMYVAGIIDVSPGAVIANIVWPGPSPDGFWIRLLSGLTWFPVGIAIRAITKDQIEIIETGSRKGKWR